MSLRVLISGVVPLAVVLAGAAPSEGFAEEAPRILNVTHRARDSRRASPSLMPGRLDMAAVGAEEGGTEWFYVYWDPGRDGSLPGTVVTFEFRQASRPLIRTLFIQYPFKVKGERCATFEIAEPTIRRGGRVAAWRVRIVRGGRRLAERTSGSWSQER
jgi:hypothetical protein